MVELSARSTSPLLGSERTPSPRTLRRHDDELHRDPRDRDTVKQIVELEQDRDREEKTQKAKDSAKPLLDKLVLVPDRGTKTAGWVQAWEVLTSMLVLACAYAIPFSLALPTVATQELLRLNRFLDIVFSLDLAVQFFIAFRKPEHSDTDTLWEKRVPAIARRYCGVPFSDKGEGGWFWMDAASVLPGWLTPFVSSRYDHVLKTLRSMRLLRCIRLTKLSRKIEDHQGITGVPFFLSDIMKFIFVTTIVSHVAACMWVALEGKVNPSFMQSKVSWLAALRSGKGDCCEPDAEHDPLCVYNFAIYWAMMTLTSVGYGDITPQNPIEYFMCTVFMLLAGFVWAYIVGGVVSLLSQLDKANAEFKSLVDQLNVLIDNRGLSTDLRFKLREYTVVARATRQSQFQRQILEENVTFGLQREVLVETPLVGTFSRKVFWAHGLEQDALLEIIRTLRIHLYGKQESIPIKDRMLVIREGIAAVAGRVVGRNAVVGDKSILLNSDYLINDQMPKTLSYVTVLALRKAALVGVCETYPLADERLRRAQIRTAVWRGFVHAAKEETNMRRRCGRSAIDHKTVHLHRHKGGWLRSISRDNDEATPFVTGADVKEVEGRLQKGQTELRYHIGETRKALHQQREMMDEIVEGLRQHAGHGNVGKTWSWTLPRSNTP